MLRELVRERSRIEQEIAVLETQLANVMVDIQDVMAMQLESVRTAQAKEFGAVNVVCEGYKVTETIPKRVKWDQEKMAVIYKSIRESGDDPLKYMQVELKVPEKAYDHFAPEVQGVFDIARIIEKGKPSIKIEEVDNA